MILNCDPEDLDDLAYEQSDRHRTFVMRALAAGMWGHVEYDTDADPDELTLLADRLLIAMSLSGRLALNHGLIIDDHPDARRCDDDEAIKVAVDVTSIPA